MNGNGLVRNWRPEGLGSQFTVSLKEEWWPPEAPGDGRCAEPGAAGGEEPELWKSTETGDSSVRHPRPARPAA